MTFGGSKRARKCVVIALCHQVTGQATSRLAAAKPCVQRSLHMVPARKKKESKGLSVGWWDDKAEMPTWLPLRGGKERKHWEGRFKVKRAGGKSPVNEQQPCVGKSAKTGRHVPVKIGVGESTNRGDISR